MTWKITFYNEKVEKELTALPIGIRANLTRTLELINKFGPNLGRPHTASMGKGLFEIRAKGNEGIARTLFCTHKGQEVIILLTIIKKIRQDTKKIFRDSKKENEGNT